MNILVSGSSGMVGSELVTFLQENGHNVLKLVRKKSERENEVFWDPEKKIIEDVKLKNIDAIVHLAGESIASGRWTSNKKEQILSSRVKGTDFISEIISKMVNKPKVLVSASAIGFYGNRGDEDLNEKSSPGKLFLSEVCKAWEDSTLKAQKSGVRVVNLRIGIVLDKSGGALKKMLLPFNLGVGGNMGSGKQYWSWLTLKELVNIINFSINNDSISGPVNAVSPQPLRNSEFTRVLAKVLKRPAIFPMPEFAGKIALGEMADELLFASSKVIPDKLLKSGYSFIHNNLEDGLKKIL